jgi:hypothetical protein
MYYLTLMISDNIAGLTCGFEISMQETELQPRSRKVVMSEDPENMFRLNQMEKMVTCMLKKLGSWIESDRIFFDSLISTCLFH